MAEIRKGLKNPQLDEQWKNNCTGPGSTDAKKQMLLLFLKSGGSLKSSQAYLTELTKMSKVSGEKTQEEWVSFEVASRPMACQS